MVALLTVASFPPPSSLLEAELGVADEPPAGEVGAVDGLLPEDELAASATKGLRELPPRALVRSNLKESITLCCCKLADGESLLMGFPDFEAHIQEADDDVRSIVPPVQDAALDTGKKLGN